jgi:hypothetical protein
VFNASGHSTECTSTNNRLPVPRPNHNNASGSSAIDGRRVEHGGQHGQQIAANARGHGKRRQHEREHHAEQITSQQHGQEIAVFAISSPDQMPCTKAVNVSVKVGSSRSLPTSARSHFPDPDQH